ncbi:MAG TPA: glycosyltransferase family 39 protein [Kiritimatiellia bacterium]|nr:glycosyltransferase family 39 protein [Kiritimatiellia bacterium]
MQPKSFESRIQDIVYNVDVGVGRRLIKAGLFILATLGLMTLYTASQFSGLKDADAMDQAQIAFRIMKDGEFSTKVIRPAGVWLLEQHGHDPREIMLKHPDIVHPPVYPWILSFGLRILGNVYSPEKYVRATPPEQWAIVPLGHICTLLTGLMVFLIARRFFEPRIAALSTALFFVSDVVWANSISGLSLSMATLFATLSVYFCLAGVVSYKSTSAGRIWIVYLVLSALFCALTFLTRYSAGWITLAVLITIALLIPNHGWKIALATAGVILLAVSPWIIRNYQVSGKPFGLTPYTALNGINPSLTHSFERTVNPSIELFSKELKVKWFSNIGRYYETALPSTGNGLIMALFVTTFFFRFSRDHMHILRLGMLAAMIGLILVAGLFDDETIRTVSIFWPLIILYGVSFFYLLMDRMQTSLPVVKSSLIGVIVLTTALPLVITLMPPRKGYPYPPYYPSFTTSVTRYLQEDDLLCTDMPWATAWYGDRSSLLLPATIDEFYKINDLKKRISGIYFTTLTRDLPFLRGIINGPYNSWADPLVRRIIPANFPLTEGMFINEPDQLFLTDRQLLERR